MNITVKILFFIFNTVPIATKIEILISLWKTECWLPSTITIIRKLGVTAPTDEMCKPAVYDSFFA